MREVVGRHYRTGQWVSVVMEEGRIAAIREARPADEPVWVAPGLVDAQVNGYAGIDFNGRDVDPEQVANAVAALWRDGVTTVLPTIITGERQAMLERLRAFSHPAGTGDALVSASLLGLHLEGPFLSPEPGPRGAHPASYIGPPDLGFLQQSLEAAGGRLVLVTLSPEWPTAPDAVRWLVEHGVRVAIGHTAATSEQIAAAVAAGASLSTHLGNGAHPVLPRHPHYIWDQLADDRLYASVIGDGFHLPWAVLRVFLRAKRERLYVVSDAVRLAGLPPGEYVEPVGGHVTLRADGRLSLAEDPAILAGSAVPLIKAVGRMAAQGLEDWASLWDRASRIPAGFFGRPEREGLAVGAPADLVRIRWSEDGPEVLETVKRGVTVYRS